MTTICSNTLVKNGMPFIGAVLAQVAPFMDHMIITVSEKSTDETMSKVKRISKLCPGNVDILIENVSLPEELTLERQRQLEDTDEDWVFFLDDDDFWPRESLELMLNKLGTEDVDAYSVRPFQVIDKDFCDREWSAKWFTKFFKNQRGVHYEGGWPRDLVCKDKEVLYWKTNDRVVNVPEAPFFHLSYIKDSSFRDEKWASKFRAKKGGGVPYPKEYKKYLEEIYGYIR